MYREEKMGVVGKAMLGLAGLAILYVLGGWLYMSVDNPLLRQVLGIVAVAIPVVVLTTVRVMSHLQQD